MSSDPQKSWLDTDGGMGRSTRDSPVTTNTSGYVTHDDRGNAVWKWAMATGAFQADTSSARLKKLVTTNLTLVEDARPPVEDGYSPYDSGLLVKKPVHRRKDLKKLSEWLLLRKQAGANKQHDD